MQLGALLLLQYIQQRGFVHQEKLVIYRHLAVAKSTKTFSRSRAKTRLLHVVNVARESYYRKLLELHPKLRTIKGVTGLTSERKLFSKTESNQIVNYLLKEFEKEYREGVFNALLPVRRR